MRSFDEVLSARRSVRQYTERPIEPEVRRAVLGAALRAPTAGNLMLYSILEIDDQEIKDRLAVTCDHQPFIAKAPWVLVFLADYQRTMDCFAFAGAGGERPREADFLLACCDALIAAQTAAIAAEAHGLGSCYIGDVMENWETHRDLLRLPRYAFPIAMLCLGWPTESQKRRPQPSRFDSRIVVHPNTYRSVTKADIEAMYGPAIAGESSAAEELRALYGRKFVSEFAVEMRRSVSGMLENWR